MKDKTKGLVLGLAIGTMLTGATTYAATTAKIEVVYENLKYMVDGVQKRPSAGEGFIYQGTTYVPLRFASEATGKDVTWDGKNKTIWIGKKEGEFKYLSDIEYARKDSDYFSDVYFNQNADRNKISIAGSKYERGISAYTYSYSSKASVDYNINGAYKKLTGFIGVDDATKNSKSTASIKIIGDGKELASYTDLKGGDMPREITVDLTGVLKLQIVFEHDEQSSNKTYVNLAEVKIFK
ncbi:NPCBM/NEW2 domain-containing protein [Paenibacillus aquistagni]|uniref:NPCBM/NEW2 domain-containing protein n=1 Tax=Paenibacillus aquistagni TaxID=1852522 RepID=UPI00145B331B|nr:NPCBM/NEW2 domain-containing protein [Paenibacillus aquistagni]NMM52054.1 hypothetical protein [Paenibacillus aquistagni]